MEGRTAMRTSYDRSTCSRTLFAFMAPSNPSSSDCVRVCATCVMAIEWHTRLLSHRMVDDIRLPAYHWISLSNTPGKMSPSSAPYRGSRCLHPLRGDGSGSVLYFEWLCDVKHSSLDQKDNFEVEITWRATENQYVLSPRACNARVAQVQ